MSEDLPVPEGSSPTPTPLHLAGIAGVLLLLTVWAFWPSTASSNAQPGVQVDPDGVYNPVLAGESLPDDFRQLLPRDAIRPVYDPDFTSAEGVNWPDNTDVIGVLINGEAKAYPVDHLNGRELVVDELGGEPILVSW